MILLMNFKGVYNDICCAPMAELADARRSGRRGILFHIGSNPTWGIFHLKILFQS